jgi:RNA polymerase II-associated factor 1
VPPSKTYDKRLLNGLFRPIEKSEAEEEAFQLATQAHERDPQNNPKPPAAMNYDFYLNDSAESAEKFRQKFDVDNPKHDDDTLYTHKSRNGPNFQFSRIRAYETAQETELDHVTKYDDEVILAYNENARDRAVYFYPVMQRSTIRPQRTKNIQRTIGVADTQEQIVDQLDITVNEPTDELKDYMEKYKEQPYGFDDPQEDEPPQENRAEERATNGRAAEHSDEDLDADGDEEE